MSLGEKENSQIIAEIGKNAASFTTYNRFKTQTCLREFSVAQEDVFLLVPALLHTIGPERIAGMGSESAPAGICQYRPGGRIQNLVRKYFGKKERFDSSGAERNSPIEFLSLMGSIGSVAYTDKSDFDYWCCIREDIEKEAQDLLQEKLHRIEEWCDKAMGVEVHFFITTAKMLAENDFGEVSKESCGSALGKLLKEEYFRGSLLIAGRIPYWWVFPVGISDKEYADRIEMLRSVYPGTSNDYLDIGNLVDIPGEEFLGGGLWQLNKGVGSIFKSVLKMALLLQYSDPSADRTLLATVLKQQVLENPNDTEFLDPYQNMIDRVLHYYSGKKDDESVDLLRSCFFMKIHIKVSHKLQSNNRPEKNSEAVMLDYCKQWGWTEKELGTWEHFNHLPLKETIAYKSAVEHFMLSGLDILKERVGAEALARVLSGRDFNMLVNRLTDLPHNS